MTKRILVADDHVLFGDLLETFLVAKGYSCVRVFDYEKLLSFALDAEASDVDIVLLDVMMPGFRSAITLEKVSKAFSPVPVVALTSVPAVELAKEAISCGLSGYLQKTMALKKIPIVLEFILAGETYIEGLTQNSGSELPNRSLSSLEKRVLAMISQGMSNKEIALATDNTETNIKSINRTLSRKFNVKNRTQLALRVVRNPQILGIEGAYHSIGGN